MNRGIRGLAVTIVSALCLVAVSAPAAAKGKDPFVGNWQFDAAKSTFNGRTAYTSAKVSMGAVKGAHKFAGDFTTADGKSMHVEYSGPADGSSLAATGSPTYDSVSVLMPDKDTLIRTERRGGKVVGITTVTLDKGGKSFTATSRGTLPDGHQYTATTVWNRVK